MGKNNKTNIRYMTKTALIAAAYVALTYMFAFLSYGAIQFRISEFLILFVLISPRYGLGLILGCIIANLASPLGVIDIVVGSTATFLAVIGITLVRSKIKKGTKGIIIASLCPVISNAVLVGLELTYLFSTPFVLNAAYVAIGEFVVVTLFGTFIMNTIMKNESLVENLNM